MITLIRTSSDHKDFKKLIIELDMDLEGRNGEDNSFFVQFNKSDTIKYVVLAYENNIPVGCGALREYSQDSIEIKRMFVLLEKRGRGIAAQILNGLENWVRELNFQKCILETGEKQLEAIHLYKKNQYKIIPNYGEYKDVKSSICFEKIISI